jgi:hypothetical protein
MDAPWTSYLVQHALCADCKTWMSVLPCLHIHLVRWRAQKNWLRGAACRTDTPLTVEERRARDSLADCQSHGMYLANLIVRLWMRTGRSAHASKAGQHLACREARRVSAVSGDLGVSPSIVIYYVNDPGLSSK